MHRNDYVLSGNNQRPGVALRPLPTQAAPGVLASLPCRIGLVVLLLYGGFDGAKAQTSEARQSALNDIAEWMRSVNNISERYSLQMQKELGPLNIQDALTEPVLQDPKEIAERRRRIATQIRIMSLTPQRIKENINQERKLADNIVDPIARGNLLRSFAESSSASLVKAQQVVDLKLKELRLTDELLAFIDGHRADLAFDEGKPRFFNVYYEDTLLTTADQINKAAMRAAQISADLQSALQEQVEKGKTLFK
jgi:hypothetical protein